MTAEEIENVIFNYTWGWGMEGLAWHTFFDYSRILPPRIYMSMSHDTVLTFYGGHGDTGTMQR